MTSRRSAMPKKDETINGSALLGGAKGAINLDTVRITTLETKVRELTMGLGQLRDLLIGNAQNTDEASIHVDTIHLLLLMLGVSQDEFNRAREILEQMAQRREEERQNGIPEENSEIGTEPFPMNLQLARRAECTVPVLQIGAAVSAIENILRDDLNVSDERIRAGVEKAIEAMKQTSGVEDEEAAEAVVTDPEVAKDCDA